MSTAIEAAASSRPARGENADPCSSIELASAAAIRCFEQQHCTSSAIDMLVNVGVFADGFIMEPASASLIQRRINANPNRRPGCERRTLSFDLNNGGCGVLSAFRMADALVSSGSIERAMVVCSDVNVTGALSSGFCFDEGGGAVLLSGNARTGEGFVAHASRSFPEAAPAFTARARNLGAAPEPPVRCTGAYILTICEQSAFERAAVECAYQVVSRFLDKHRLSSIDLLVPSLYPAGFGSLLAARLGLGEQVVPKADGLLLHTAGVIAGLETSMRDGRFFQAANILFVTIGSGLTASVAWYRRSITAGEVVVA